MTVFLNEKIEYKKVSGKLLKIITQEIDVNSLDDEITELTNQKSEKLKKINELKDIKNLK